MKIGTKVVLVLRRVNDRRVVVGKYVCRAQIMVTGKQNFGRQRVRLLGPGGGTAWVNFDEEGTEWARGWNSISAKALCACVAMEKS